MGILIPCWKYNLETFQWWRNDLRYYLMMTQPQRWSRLKITRFNILFLQ
jgi:hypothetical protein